MYYKLNQEAEVIDFYADEKNEKRQDSKKPNKSESSKSWMRLNEMTIESAENYELLSRRAPFTFDMFKEKMH